MGLKHRFIYVDGREIEAGSAMEFFEKLREGETLPPADLGRYLDLIHSRGLLGFGVNLDLGARGGEIASRCQRALASLINHGWVRLSGRPDALRPRRLEGRA